MLSMVELLKQQVEQIVQYQLDTGGLPAGEGNLEV